MHPAVHVSPNQVNGIGSREGENLRLDTQQRVVPDVAELRSRTASIEQILQTVE
jgi:hypothetical protein